MKPTERDLERQAEVARRLERAWRCTLHDYPARHFVDYYAERHEQVVALVEVKCRNVPSTEYAEVYLAAHKWLALTTAAIGHGVPGLFVVAFADEIMAVDVATIAATPLVLGGRTDRPGEPHDVAPLVLCPVRLMWRVEKK